MQTPVFLYGSGDAGTIRVDQGVDHEDGGSKCALNALVVVVCSVCVHQTT